MSEWSILVAIVRQHYFSPPDEERVVACCERMCERVSYPRKTDLSCDVQATAGGERTMTAVGMLEGTAVGMGGPCGGTCQVSLAINGCNRGHLVKRTCLWTALQFGSCCLALGLLGRSHCAVCMQALVMMYNGMHVGLVVRFQGVPGPQLLDFVSQDKRIYNESTECPHWHPS